MAIRFGVFVALVLVGLTAFGGAGCKPATPPPGEQPGGGTPGGTGGTGGGTGGPGGVPGQPGDGLPIELTGGLLAFGLFTANPDDTLSALTLATVDQGGQGFGERFSLSRHDDILILSPDGRKLASRRVEPVNNVSFWAYDFGPATVTRLGLPPFAEIDRYFCWLRDSGSIVYSCLAETGDRTTSADDVWRLARVPVDGTPGAYVDTVGVLATLPRQVAPVPGRDAVVFTGPPNGIVGLNVNIHDFEAGSGRDPIDPVATIYPLTAWSADGSAFFLAAGKPNPSETLGLPVGVTTIYRIDPTTGDFTAIYTCAENQCVRSLNMTP